MSNCDVVTLPLVSWVRQVWCLIVSIPVLCLLSYFNIKWLQESLNVGLQEVLGVSLFIGLRILHMLRSACTCVPSGLSMSLENESLCN